MAEHVLFLTGRLARPRLEKVLAELTPAPFEWTIADMGVKVAALMTEAIILRRLDRDLVARASRVVVPGRCRADLERLASGFGCAFERGPDEVRDIPEWLGRKSKAPLLAEKSVRIFAEIVEAPLLDLDEILARGVTMREDGADVIDLGCLPDSPFLHLEETVRELKTRGLAVSVDSAEPDELRRGGVAGADYLLSLTEGNIAIAEETGARVRHHRCRHTAGDHRGFRQDRADHRPCAARARHSVRGAGAFGGAGGFRAPVRHHQLVLRRSGATGAVACGAGRQG